MNIDEMSAKDLLYHILGQSYLCPICHKVIYPTITEINVHPISLSLSQDKTQARGGVGNKIIQDNVCCECSKAFKSLYMN
jgi:hypothetical protein